MAGQAGSPTDNPLLRGLFGTLQTGSAQSASTADIWQQLRVNAGEIQFRAQGAAQPYDPVAVEQAGRAILTANGVNAATVSSFRGVAGEWNQARQRLAQLEDGQQITASEIWRPPWAITTSGEVPSRYRIRSQWQFENAAGIDPFQWRADELDGPLSTVPEALSQAPPPTKTYPPELILGASGPPKLVSYEIEQI